MSALSRNADMEQHGHNVRVLKRHETVLRDCVCFLGNAPNISSFDSCTGLTNLSSQVEHDLALAGGFVNGRLYLSHVCPKQFGPRSESALRSLPRRTLPGHSSLLAHAILFLGVYGRIPAAPSSRNQNQNIPA